MATIVSLINMALEDLHRVRAQSMIGEVGHDPHHEFEEAIAHLEEARFRVNNGFAMKFGIHKPGDVEQFHRDGPQDSAVRVYVDSRKVAEGIRNEDIGRSQ